MYTDMDKKLMTFEFFLESSKIVYEANFLNQKNELTQGISVRRKLLADANGKKQNKTSKKESLPELLAKQKRWDDMKKCRDRQKKIKEDIDELKEKQKAKLEREKNGAPVVNVEDIKLKIEAKQKEYDE